MGVTECAPPATPPPQGARALPPPALALREADFFPSALARGLSPTPRDLGALAAVMNGKLENPKQKATFN